MSPAVSSKQRKLMGLAEHNPSAVYKKNKSVLSMSKNSLHDFASTKGLKDKKKKKISYSGNAIYLREGR